MRLKLILLVLLASLAFVACGRAEHDAPESTAATTTVTPTPDQSVVGLLGPLPKDGTLIQAPEDAHFFVVDVTAGDVYAIAGVDRKRQQDGVRWLDDDSLLVQAYQGTYEVSLDGTVSLVSPTSAPTPTPRNCTCTDIRCSICEPPAASADGIWRASRDPSGYGTTVIGVPDLIAFRLTNADEPAWAPVGHLLAFNGNVCVGAQNARAFDIFLFDPVSRQLTNLTEPFGHGFDFLWRPDGQAIAADATDSVDELSLGLIQVPGGEYHALVRIGGWGYPLPIQWNAAGTRLIFFRSGGPNLCEGMEDPRIVLPQPTTVEVLRE